MHCSCAVAAAMWRASAPAATGKTGAALCRSTALGAGAEAGPANESGKQMHCSFLLQLLCGERQHRRRDQQHRRYTAPLRRTVRWPGSRPRE